MQKHVKTDSTETIRGWKRVLGRGTRALKDWPEARGECWYSPKNRDPRKRDWVGGEMNFILDKKALG